MTERRAIDGAKRRAGGATLAPAWCKAAMSIRPPPTRIVRSARTWVER